MYHYHSVFDSERWQELYADPGFLRHVRLLLVAEGGYSPCIIQIAVAKFLGLQTLRLADAIVLPINTTNYAVQLDEYLDGCVMIAPLKLYPLLKQASVSSDSPRAPR